MVRLSLVLPESTNAIPFGHAAQARARAEGPDSQVGGIQAPFGKLPDARSDCEYVEREEKREQLRQDALAAWAAYQADGLHVTAEEADAWLEKLEAGEDVEPPECHT